MYFDITIHHMGMVVDESPKLAALTLFCPGQGMSEQGLLNRCITLQLCTEYCNNIDSESGKISCLL